MNETVTHIYNNYDKFIELNNGMVKDVLNNNNNKLSKYIEEIYGNYDEKWNKSMYLTLLIELYKTTLLL